MSDAITYRLLRTASELEAFEPAWRLLWEQDPEARPFQSPEWLLPWWHAFGNDDLRVIAVLAGDLAVGLLPFYIYREPKSGERQMLLLGAGTSDYCDGLFAPSCDDSQIRRAIELACEQEGWDALYLSQMAHDSRLLRVAETSALPMSVYQADASMRRAAVPVSDLPLKLRRNVRNARNRAQRLGRIELTTANESDWPEIFEALIQLHTERWHEQRKSGVLADPRVRQWHREALPCLLRRGMLRLYGLRLNGEIIAALYSLVDAPWGATKTQYFYMIGYSTAYAELSPGTLLLGMAIEQAWNEGVAIIDMLRGDEPYKQHWHADAVPAFGVELRRDAMRMVADQTAEAAA